MQKKALYAVCLSMFMLCGCGEAPSEQLEEAASPSIVEEVVEAVQNTSQDEEPLGEAQVALEEAVAVDNGYVFAYKGVKLVIDADVAETLPALGEANQVAESPSCAFDGTDRVYTYSNLVIATYEIDGVERYASISFLDDIAATSEGLSLFMSYEDMVQLYGEDFADDAGFYTYEKDDMKLIISIEDDEISSITYQTKVF